MNRFDPYHTWLGIPPEEQPPNHYRLLGISLFESDRDVIRNAADQRMTYLKTYGGGQHSELSQQLLNEVSAAKVCLLNDAKRRECDDQLRQHAALSMPVETRSIAVSSAQTDTQPTDTPLGPVKRSWGNRQSTRNARRSEMLRAVVVVFVPVVFCAILVAVYFLINPGSKGETKARGASKNAPSPKPHSAVAPFTAQEAKQFQQAWADYLEIPVERVFDLAGGEKLTMVLIPPGEFMMGSTPTEQAQFFEEAKAADAHYALEQIPHEGPQHRVRITQPFYLGKYEVTQTQWKAVMENNPSRFSDRPSHPVEQVSWSDTQLFLSKLNESPNTLAVRFRLPREAEWEYACRAGTTTF